MFNVTVKTTFDHPDKHGEHIDKHRAAARKKIGDDVSMLGSKATSIPRADGGHDVVLETTWGPAKPVEVEKPNIRELRDPVKDAIASGQTYDPTNPKMVG